jgi:F-type H+-transporting ATPase subunit b
MQFDWWTFLLEAINFLVLIWLLRYFLYRPAQAIIAKRKARVEEGLAGAEAARQAAEAEKADYEARKAGLGTEREKMLEQAHKAIETERHKMLADAGAEADHFMRQAREEIETERAAAIEALEMEAGRMAVDIASRILRETGSAGVSDAAIDILLKQVADMPEEERTRLARGPGGGKPSVEVVSATPLRKARQTAVAKMLAQHVDADIGVAFKADDGLLGGAEFHFPHAILRYSWAEALKNAERKIRHEHAAS